MDSAAIFQFLETAARCMGVALLVALAVMIGAYASAKDDDER